MSNSELTLETICSKLQAYRIKHLNRSDKEETIKKYIEYMKEVDIDWEKIAEKIEAEFERERRGERSQE